MGVGADPKSLAGRPTCRADLLGQVFTPDSIADRMASMLLHALPGRCRRFLDPAVGPATFLKALGRQKALTSDDVLVAFDIDEEMVRATRACAIAGRLAVKVTHGDYLESECPEPYDGVILNPPYVRQEWIDSKAHYQRLFEERYGVRIPGTANLYVYFIVKALLELKLGGCLVCVVYDSWQSTRFGRWMASFIAQHCEQLQTLAQHGQPFRGHLIDATIMSAVRTAPAAGFALEAGTSCELSQTQGPLSSVPGLATIDDLFATRRGLRLKQADFFLCDLAEASSLGATPFVKKVAKIPGYLVPDDHPEAALLATSKRIPRNMRGELQRRLRQALGAPQENESVLTWFRERPEQWYMHRPPPYAPLIFNYYLRSRPRHILNPSRAYSDNFYGLTPRTDANVLSVLAMLNSTTACTEILAASRNQGSGLAKVQLFEYRRARVPDWRCIGNAAARKLRSCGARLLNPKCSSAEIVREIDEIVAVEIASPELSPKRLASLYAQVDRSARRPKE
ncbi:MAG: N-6 DNA methylase [Phycisphaerae bacterium]